MLIEYEDFNGAGQVIENGNKDLWRNIEEVLNEMPLHIKASDQAGIQGNPIFDPVGTNEYIKNNLKERGWEVNLSIPQRYAFLGTDVDFAKKGIISEAQFSNYPFLLNNLLRSEIFYKSNIKITHFNVEMLIVITKAHMFPASNSTLYYEQGRNQLSALIDNKVFSVPIRLVGLFEDKNSKADVMYTEYSAPRYSRTVVRRERRTCQISDQNTGRSRNKRCKIKIR